jgi:hypothetical protein
MTSVPCQKCGQWISFLKATKDYDPMVEHNKVCLGRVEFDKDMTEFELLSTLRATRQQNGGISLDRIAGIIKEVFDKSEIDFLIKNLTIK